MQDSSSLNALFKEIKTFIHNINEREKWFFFKEGELYLKKTKRKLLINNKIHKEVVLEIGHISIHIQKKGIGTYILRHIHNLNTRYEYTVMDRTCNVNLQKWCEKHNWHLIENTVKADVAIFDYYLSTKIKY